MVIGNIVKPGKLKSHKYVQCYWAECTHKNKLTFYRTYTAKVVRPVSQQKEV